MHTIGKKNRTLLCLMLLLTTIPGMLTACDRDEQVPDPSSLEPNEGLGGVTIGTKQDEVRKKLGSNYQEETYVDDAGYLSEAANRWIYEDDIDLLIGRTSQQVLEMRVFSAGITTQLGVKVGDNALSACDTYRKHYTEVTSRHDNTILEGWFDIGNGAILIFDIDKDDNRLVNSPILPESTIEAIYLKDSTHID